MSSKITAFCRNPGEIIVGKVVSEDFDRFTVEDACVLITAASDQGVAFGFLPIDTLNQEPTVLFRTILNSPLKTISVFKSTLLFNVDTLPEAVLNSYSNVLLRIEQMAAQQALERAPEPPKVSLFGNNSDAAKSDNIVKLFE